MRRLFVAFDIPDDIRMLMCGMGGSIPGSRTVPTEQLHLTVKFLGDTEESLLPDIQKALATERIEPFRVQLKGLGHFPPRGTPKVLWVGIEPVAAIMKLRNHVEKSLADIGIPRDSRKFAAHVTVARLKNSPLNRVARFLADNSLFSSPAFIVRDFHLYASTLSARGAVHTRISSFPLTTAAPES